MLATIPERFLEPMKVSHSLRTRSAEYIYTALDVRLGVLTKQDFDVLKEALRKVYVYPESVETHLAGI